MRPDRLPLGGSYPQAGSAQGLRYRPDGFLRVDDDQRQHQESKGQTGGKNCSSVGSGWINQSKNRSAGERFQSPYKDGQPEDAVDDGWNASKVVDVGADQPVEPVINRVFLQVDGSSHTQRKSSQDGDEDCPQGTQDGCADTGINSMGRLWLRDKTGG